MGEHVMYQVIEIKEVFEKTEFAGRPSPPNIRNANSIRDAEMFLPKNHGINDSKRLEKTCAYLYPFVFVIYCLITYHDGSMGRLLI